MRQREQDWIRYASASQAAMSINLCWGAIDQVPLAACVTENMPNVLPVDPDHFVHIGLDNATCIIIDSKIDGKVSGFGKRLWSRFLEAKPQIAAQASESKVVRVHYSDRYLRSPLTARLLAEVIRAIPRRGAIQEIEVLTMPSDGQSGRGMLWNDWPLTGVRDTVLMTLLRGCVREVAVTTRQRSETPHDRALSVEWANGPKLTVTFDQGMGA